MLFIDLLLLSLHLLIIFLAYLNFYILFPLFFYIVGDFNIQFNIKTNFYTNEFLELLELSNLSQHCHFASHSSGNTIDHFITSSFIKPISILTHPISFSDHYFIQPSFPANPIKFSSTVKVFARSWSQLEKTLFIKILSASSVDSSSFTDIDDFVLALDSLLTDTLNVLLPLNLLPTVFPPSKLLVLMMNASHSNVLYASSNVLIVPLPLLPLMFFGFLTFQPIALSSTPNTRTFLFFPSTLLPLLPLDHLTLLQRLLLPLSLFLTFHPSLSQNSSPSSNLYLHLPAPLTRFFQKSLMIILLYSIPSFSILLTFL